MAKKKRTPACCVVLTPDAAPTPAFQTEVTPQQAAPSQRRMRSLMGKAGERSPPPLHRRPGTSSMTRGRGLNG